MTRAESGGLAATAAVDAALDSAAGPAGPRCRKPVVVNHGVAEHLAPLGREGQLVEYALLEIEQVVEAIGGEDRAEEHLRMRATYAIYTPVPLRGP